MIIKVLFHYIFGFLNIIIEGYYIERFINRCKNEKIMIWNLKRKKDIHLEFRAGKQDFKKLCKIAKQTQCKIKIKRKKGVPFVVHRYKKRKIFLGLLIVFALLLMLSSNFVWNVDIQIENNEILENIAEDIKSYGLKTGELKSKVDTKEIIHKVRLQRNDVAWIGIELKGTNAIVKLVKAAQKPEIIDENEYCNVVSDKAGVITKINAQSGTANVKVGDMIQPGDILINGWMEGKYTGIRYAHAKGEVEAKVWYTKNKTMPYTATEREETGEEQNKYRVKINNFEINLGKRLSKFEICDTIETEDKFKIFSNFYLPISIIKTNYKEVKEVEKNYTLEEAKSLGIKELEEELEAEIENKDNIVNTNIHFLEKENEVEVFVTYEVLENIGTNEKIVF